MAQRQFRSDDTDKWLLGFGDGSDGDATIAADATHAPIDSSCSGSSGGYSLSATNASFVSGQLVIIHQSRGTGAGNWELNKIASYVAGTITLAYPLINTYTDSGDSQAQVVVMPQYNNYTINGTKTLTLKAWNENVGGIFAIFAKGTVTITGTLLATGTGYLGGAHGPQFAHGYCGEGTVGARNTNGTANGNGGAGKQSEGSGGGNGAAAINNPTSGGAGGAAAGSASLVSMVFGGAGGGAGDGGSNIANGNGGNGAGIVLIITKAFTMSGAITLTGNPNGAACADGHRGGSGAGGSCLIKAQTATLGSNLITALAGSATANGSAGAVGRVHIDYKTSYTGTTNPTIDATQDSTLDYVASGNPMMYSYF